MSRLIKYLEMIKIEHSLFALPFALTAMVIAANGFPEISVILWIVVAMVFARAAAMGLNRLIDADIDKKNPRTAKRHLPLGIISKPATLFFIIISIVIYIFATYKLNMLAFILSPIPILIFILYSYSKRFTNLCHIILGVALGLSPIGAWVAVRGSIDLEPILLSIAVLFWSAGFDILYAILDIDFDRENSIHSIPSYFGITGSLVISKIFHLMAFIFLLLTFFNSSVLDYIYLSGVILSGAFMLYEHSLINRDNLSKLNTAFFNINVYISVTIFLFTVADILVS